MQLYSLPPVRLSSRPSQQTGWQLITAEHPFARIIPELLCHRIHQGQLIPIRIQGYEKASAEEVSYLTDTQKNTFSPEKYAKKQAVFGVIIFESDQNLKPKSVYLYYEKHWLWELVFNRYKSDECLDHPKSAEYRTVLPYVLQ